MVGNSPPRRQRKTVLPETQASPGMATHDPAVMSSSPLPAWRLKASVRSAAKELEQLRNDHRRWKPGWRLQSQAPDVAYRLRPLSDPNVLQDDPHPLSELDDGPFDDSLLDDPNSVFHKTSEFASALRAKDWGVDASTVQAWDEEEVQIVDDSADSTAGLDQPCPPSSQSDNLTAEVDCDEYGRVLTMAMQRSAGECVARLLQMEIAIHKYSELLIDSIERHAYAIVMSLDDDVLQALLRGNLATQDGSDSALRKKLDHIQERAEHTKQPVIYLNTLLDYEGQSPTPRELLQVLDVIDKEYLMRGRCDTPCAIDSFKTPHIPKEMSAKGVRKYLTRGSRGTGKILKGRVAQLKIFCANLRQRLECIPPDGQDLPLKRALLEFGYTCDAKGRLEAHRKHQSSNFIMNLFEAINHHLFEGKCHIHQIVVYLVDQPMHAILAEIVLTRLGNGYIFNAGGFSFYPAGRSNDSYRKYSNAQYAEWLEWTLTHTPLLANHERELERRDKPVLPATVDISVAAVDVKDSLGVWGPGCDEAWADMAES